MFRATILISVGIVLLVSTSTPDLPNQGIAQVRGGSDDFYAHFTDVYCHHTCTTLGEVCYTCYNNEAAADCKDIESQFPGVAYCTTYYCGNDDYPNYGEGFCTRHGGVYKCTWWWATQDSCLTLSVPVWQ